MAALLETPSRIWRRIEAIEGRDMPSLPSLPTFDDSADEHTQSSSDILGKLDDNNGQEEKSMDISGPTHSTPAMSSHHASTIRATASTSSTARFAHSIASRSAKSSLALSGGRGSQSLSRNTLQRSHDIASLDSFDASVITSLPVVDVEPGTDDGVSKDATQTAEEESISVPEVYLPPEEEEEHGLSLADALASVNHSHDTPKKYLDYSVSLRSEAKPSPRDRFRNVAIRERKTITTRTRTPSLSRTTPSPNSSPSNSTPRSNHTVRFSPNSSRSATPSQSPLPGVSIPLPRSNTASPAIIPLPRSNTASPAIIVHHADDDLTESILSEREPSLGDVNFDLGEESMEMEETGVHGSVVASDTPPDPSEARFEVENEEEEEHEPTFSSEGDPTPHISQNITQNRSNPGAQSPNAVSSPTPSMTFTPTPAFPRRARFANDDENPPEHDIQDEEPITPNTRRRSFLLAVINSTSRPRLKYPTPHPRRDSIFHGTPSIAESTPAATHDSSSSGPTPGPTLQAAFAGVTPRPRVARRGSHPLAQTYIAEASPPSGDSRSGSISPRPTPSETGSGSENNAHLGILPPWSTPGPSGSPYDGASDRASFISTASSHDLTTHHRANTSFDPVLGLGAQGHGLGRFNAGKLNTYLHSLNRRLQEENEALLERVKRLEEERGGEGGKAEEGSSVADGGVGGGRRLSGGSRRVSLAGTALGDVKEDVSAEGWMEEKVQLEELVEDLQTKLDEVVSEKSEMEKALDEERAERARDKERWKERMGEVEKGVEEIVRDLEGKLENAGKVAKEAEADWEQRLREVERKLFEVKGERDAALERVIHAERALESGKDLGAELASANERIAQLTGDLRNANIHISDLEEEVAHADAKLEGLEKRLGDEKEATHALERELHQMADEAAAKDEELERKEVEVVRLQDELKDSKGYISELEEAAEAAVERIETLENQADALGSSQRDLERALDEAHQQIEALQDEVHRANELARQMEEALEAAEQKMLSDENEVVELKGKIAALEREKEREKEREASLIMAKEPSRSYALPSSDLDVEVLEAELDDAHKEIARLTTLLNQSPARKAVEKARETKIEILEKENEELKERVKMLRTSVAGANTPSRIVNTSGMSPFHRQVLAMSIRDPRTPGGPLRDMSWLNNSPADASASPYLAEINRLQKELDLANQSIDDKLDKLEDVGLDIVGLTRKLEDARARIINLEDEIARLSRKEERRVHRLERLRCKKCLTKVDCSHLIHEGEDLSYIEDAPSGLPTEPPTPPTKTSEALRAKLHAVNDNLASMRKHWEEEKSQLLGEKALLQDATNRLNTQLRNAKEETKRASESGKAKERIQADIQQELENARQVIAGLESDLKSERARIRVLGTEQSRAQREKDDVLAQMQRTESDMNDVKTHLQRLRKENHDLETELRNNANADQKARLLEAKLAETAETIEQLRQERSLLAADHKQLQRRYTEISEQSSRLRQEHAASQASHDNRRQQLDLQQTEIEELRQALSQQTTELQKAAAEKTRIANEKKDVARTIAVLESDLQRVRKQAEALGRDLKLLRADKERLEAKRKEDAAKAERTQKQSQSQIRLLNEQLQTQKDKVLRVQNQLKTHTCAADDRKLDEIRIQHKEECKGLLVNIRYLQAKLLREGTFRLDLGYQKQYLLVLLAQFEKSEQTIIAAIAKIGYPLQLPNIQAKKASKLKSVVLCLIFLTRAKLASDRWKEHTASKAAVVSALHEVRRQRMT